MTELAAALSDMAYQNYHALQNSIKLEKISRSQTNYMVNLYSNTEKMFALWRRRIFLFCGWWSSSLREKSFFRCNHSNDFIDYGSSNGSLQDADQLWLCG